MRSRPRRSEADVAGLCVLPPSIRRFSTSRGGTRLDAGGLDRRAWSASGSVSSPWRSRWLALLGSDAVISLGGARSMRCSSPTDLLFAGATLRCRAWPACTRRDGLPATGARALPLSVSSDDPFGFGSAEHICWWVVPAYLLVPLALELRRAHLLQASTAATLRRVATLLSIVLSRFLHVPRRLPPRARRRRRLFVRGAGHGDLDGGWPYVAPTRG